MNVNDGPMSGFPAWQEEQDRYFILAARWAETLGRIDPRRFSTVVTRPNSPESRAFLDAWDRSQKTDILNRIERL